MKESLSQRILRYLKSNSTEWVNGGKLEQLAMEHGYKASNCSRRARELESDGFIIKKIDGKSRSVWYKVRDLPSNHYE